MNAASERPMQAVLTPWVIALVALIGLNAFSEEYPRLRRDDFSGKATLTQQGEMASISGNISGPLVFLVTRSSWQADVSESRIYGLEVNHEEPLAEFPYGAVRGRAPPVMNSARVPLPLAV